MKRIAILAVGIALLLPSVALAAGSTCQAYNRETCTVTTSTISTASGGPGTGSNASGPTGTTARGTLPFTGVDAVLLAGGGLTLLFAGFTVRRLSRRSN